MKTKKAILTLAVAALFAGFTACSNKQEQAHHDHAAMDDSEMPQDHKDMNHSGHDMEASRTTVTQSNLTDEQAKKVLNAYLQLKDALVETDGESASSAAGNLVAVIGKEAQELAGKIRENAHKIVGTKNIEEQRDHFNALSENIYTMVKGTDATDETLYRQYCPMAMNNNGAYWLSSNEEIRNPYFGDKMLKCGRVDETIE